jgi:hypothetical protein
MSSKEKFAEADRLEEQAQKLRVEAREEWLQEQSAIPLQTRLIYAAWTRCPCGAGLAYDPAGESGQPFRGFWDCSAILLGTANPSVKHEGQLPFAFYSVKSENQPSAGGATTRPK